MFQRIGATALSQVIPARHIETEQTIFCKSTHNEKGSLQNFPLTLEASLLIIAAVFCDMRIRVLITEVYK